MKIERLVVNPTGLIEAFGVDVPPEELERLQKLLETMAEIQRATLASRPHPP